LSGTRYFPFCPPPKSSAFHRALYQQSSTDLRPCSRFVHLFSGAKLTCASGMPSAAAFWSISRWNQRGNHAQQSVSSHGSCDVHCLCWAVSAEIRAYRATKQATTWQQRYNSESTRSTKTAVPPPEPTIHPSSTHPSTVIFAQATAPPQRPPDFGTSSKYWDIGDGLFRQSRVTSMDTFGL
jgi:hypothetical protein